MRRDKRGDTTQLSLPLRVQRTTAPKRKTKRHKQSPRTLYLWRVIVTEDARHGGRGKPEIMFTQAYTEAQAARNIRLRWNQAHGFVSWRHVEMTLERIPEKPKKKEVNVINT